MPPSSRSKNPGHAETRSPRPTRSDFARVRSLLAWYRKSARDLPWRRTRDPYRIWISETMLQQTRVSAVIPYYERFLQAFPDVRSLARASEERVLGYWSGLGYYSRARNLKRAAQRIVERHGGVFPSDPESLAELPGVGRYTQGALLSLAFDRPFPVVDGNVERVLARWFQVTSDPKSTAGRRVIWELAATLLPPPSAAAFNQGLMELGARICKPRSPLCGACPLAAVCRAHLAGDPTAYPAHRQRIRLKRIESAAAVVVSPSKFLLVRRRSGENRGLLDLPSVDTAASAARGTAARSLRRVFRDLGLGAGPLSEMDPIRHAVMDKEYRVRLFHAPLLEDGRSGSPGKRTETSELRWVSRSKWRTAALTARARKALGVWEAAGAGQARVGVGRKKSVRKSSVRRKPVRS